jgi:uncharacterized coiled-coil DUF342 family protein
MSTDILLLVVMGSITLLAYMVAINAHGPTKLTISYLLATLMLAVSVWAIVQYVNTGLDRKQAEVFQRLETEKKLAEERIATQEQALMENKSRMNYAAKLNSIINQATGLATTMVNVDLRDYSVELDVLAARAAESQKKAQELVADFQKVKAESTYFPQSVQQIASAINELTEAAKYYVIYFRAEDSAQEELRDRMMRQKARNAWEQLKLATSQIASEG